MAFNEDIADELRKRAVNLLRFDASLRREALSQLKELERSLVNEIAAAEIDGITNYQQKRLNELLSIVRETIRSAYVSIHEALAAELQGLAEVQTAWAADIVNKSARVSLMDVGFTETQLAAVLGKTLIEGSPAEEWWSRQAGDLLRRFTQQMREGILAGETNARLIQRVRGTRANGYSDGIMKATRRNAEALVRSSVQAVANEGMLATWDRNADIIDSLMHVSTLDSRTTLICVARSGLRWTVDRKPIGHKQPFKRPPIHWNCRSVLVPVVKAFSELGMRIDAPKSTRASMDGQVPEDITFDAWLKGKPEAFQNELLGKGRAALWRDRKISLSDLIDQSDRPLTLDELRGL